MKLTKEELHDAIDEGTEIGCSPWRWGTNRTYVIERAGKHYKFTAQFHSEEGLQDEEATLVEVVAREKTITEWVPA